MNGMRLLLKSMDSYEEYQDVRPLVSMVSRCSLWHSREYVEAMLGIPSYYPFIVQLLEEKEQESSPAMTESVCAQVDLTSVDVATSDCEMGNFGIFKHKPKIIGYMEVYTLPHLGRLCDSRLERVIVDPLYRNRGICRMMMNFVTKFCKDTLHCNRIDLISANPIAISLYEKMGFEPVESGMFRLMLDT